jgi:N-acyl-D-aspartate/D-glutamate deacylase
LRADVNLIDLAAVGSTVPTLVDDLPGGGSRLVSRGTGYVATVVKGQVSFEHGSHTGTMAGHLARV